MECERIMHFYNREIKGDRWIKCATMTSSSGGQTQALLLADQCASDQWWVLSLWGAERATTQTHLDQVKNPALNSPSFWWFISVGLSCYD